MKFKIVYADELYKVQKEMNALLIDIRTREEFMHLIGVKLH